MELNDTRQLSPTEYRTKAQSSEKELLYILPQLQAKRADFLTVMLTGALHQRRTYAATPPDTQHSGPHDDDVTKSESSSRVSDASTEQSQDGAPSTLMADEHQEGLREPPSVAEVDVDPDQDPDGEDASKTLVLISPGDKRKSQTNKKTVTEADHRIFEITPPTEHAQTAVEEGHSEPGASPCASPLHTPKLVVTSSTGPQPHIVHASVTSPTFTKVEKTFVHIAETAHMNVMSSRPKEVSQGQSRSGRGPETDCSAEGEEAAEKPPPLPAPSGTLTDQTVVPDEAPLLISVNLEESGSLEDQRSLKDHALQGQQVNKVVSKCQAKSTSRIPILSSQNNLEGSVLCREVLPEKGKLTDVALRSVLKRKEQWRTQACRATSSSASLTQSATMGSEDGPHSEEERGERPRRSRIPQPLIAIKNPVLPKVAAGSVPVTSANSGFSKKDTGSNSQ